MKKQQIKKIDGKTVLDNHKGDEFFHRALSLKARARKRKSRKQARRNRRRNRR